MERAGGDRASSRPDGGKAVGLLAVAALGVVYGDIGTSPLYAIRESLGDLYGIEVVRANVLGVLSLIFWALVIVISVKYVAFVMRADNEGEGGIMALTSLVSPRSDRTVKTRTLLILLGLFGTALLYGDGMITPAISVLSAVEGLGVATPVFHPYVIPIAVVILIALFAIQHRGTGAVGSVFGPVMILWFVVLALLGLVHIVHQPGVLAAVNPAYGLEFFHHNRWHGFLALGSVFLVVTGGEALYADMGHFGVGPIRLGWFSLVMPALVLNYFGQGALLLARPDAVDNPFYRMAPEWALFPLVVLATAATVIASQALISGSFSLAMQAIQLGYTPRLRILHTSATERGQIYVGAVNWLLMVACIGLVIGFRSSSALAAAYGVAVTTTMVVTTLLFYVVVRERWGWSTLRAAALCGFLIAVDLAFFGANLLKIPHGGWFPLVIGAAVFTLMTTWKTGRQLVGARLRRGDPPFDAFLRSIREDPPARVPGTAVFMFPTPGATPPSLLANLKANHVLHETVVLLSVLTEDVPRVPAARRAEVADLGDGFFGVILRYGYMDRPNVPEALQTRVKGVSVDPEHSMFFLGRETVLATPLPGMAMWRERLFAFMYRNATSAASYFQLPVARVVELGAPVEI